MFTVTVSASQIFALGAVVGFAIFTAGLIALAILSDRKRKKK